MGNVIELAPRVEQRELEQQKTMDAVRFGREVLRLYDLGINDAVTPLWYYLRDGEAATVRIRTDFETDIAERLPRTPFVNTVSFNFTGGDFVSVKDGVSMVDMTRTTLQTINQRLSTDSLLKRELIRAKAEASEVTKLTEWFENAPIGAHLVFESLPIGSQQYAISRIYQKVGNTQLDGSFVSLHNADIEQFNELRKSLTGQAAGQTEEDILTNNFEVAGEHFKNAGEFVDHYVAAYDRLLLVKTGSDHAFGLPDNGSALQNGIEKVRKHPKLTDIYITSVRIIASSEGVVTPTLQNLTDKLGINNGTIKEGDVVTTQLARHILDKVASRIASTIDRADISSLEELNKTDVSPDAGYDMASHYGDQAEQAGETYEKDR
ncbi:hypothetical protein HGB25_02270, partial [Candidatus Saccharibacteria bacterium]|nr:hypothetical protein [Candidatus Saccharibacteria bacterium]